MKILKSMFFGRDSSWLVPIIVGLVAVSAGITMGGGGSGMLLQLASDFAIPLLSTFIGAHLAFSYAKSDRKRQELDSLLAAINLVQIELANVENSLSAIKAFKAALDSEEYPELCVTYGALDGVRAPVFELAPLSALAQHEKGRALLALRSLEATTTTLIGYVKMRNVEVIEVLHPLVEKFERTHPQKATYDEAVSELGSLKHNKLKGLYEGIAKGIDRAESDLKVAQEAVKTSGMKSLIDLARHTNLDD